MDAGARVYENVFEMLPSESNPTPLCRINALNPFRGFSLYAKLEWMNPFGSVKDRAAWALIEQLEREGKLGKHERGERGIVEPTSGNTGISLAALAGARGYRMRAVVPERVPEEKRVMLRIAGAEVDVVPDALCPAPGMPEGAIGLALSYARAQGDSYVMPNQYENRANAEAHARTTGPEIWRQTGGKVTHVFTSLGTCGTVTGLATFLRARKAGVRIIAVQPSAGHDVPGLRNVSELHVSKLFDPSLIDEIIEIEYELAYTAALELCRREGLFAGPSSGLIFEGARRVIERDRPEGGVGVAIFCDSVFKYISTMMKHLGKELGVPGEGVAGG